MEKSIKWISAGFGAMFVGLTALLVTAAPGDFVVVEPFPPVTVELVDCAGAAAWAIAQGADIDDVGSLVSLNLRRGRVRNNGVDRTVCELTGERLTTKTPEELCESTHSCEGIVE